MSHPSDHDDGRRVLDLERALESESDSVRALRLVLEEAAAITGARYAAIGVLDEERLELARFLPFGVDAATEKAIGKPPQGRGVLGLLIADPQPLRLLDVAQHAGRYGFPPSHPPMRSFLGVPIMIDGEPWGNLYLTEKDGGGQFTEADEEVVVRLAHLAAIAIERESA
jgi:GAF domain-containing protein